MDAFRPSGWDATELVQPQQLVPFQKARGAPMRNGIVQLFVGREEDQFAVRDYLQSWPLTLIALD